MEVNRAGVRFGEWGWYVRGLAIGLRNLLHNGMRLGLRKTAGKILQPINTYTRLPEYEVFGRAIRGELESLGTQGMTPRVLDLGSPKLFGLVLLQEFPAEVHLTDISRSNLDEYAAMTGCLGPHRRGQGRFVRVDGRGLPYSPSSFDAAYAMSVIEHVEGDREDTHALEEIARVLKPGGLLVISIPMGPRFLIQTIVGRIHGTDPVTDRSPHFFQRIYSRESVRERILAPLGGLIAWEETRTIFRRSGWLTRGYHRMRSLLGANLMGLLGATNVAASMLLNREARGLQGGFLSKYGQQVTLADIYWDAILIGRRKPDRPGNGGVESREPARDEEWAGSI